jgi:hypothetical protein
MALRSVNKNFKNRGKDVKYLNKDFSQFKENLIEFARTYFPKAYNDFSDASPGTLFIEMAAYVGDVLSYYIDDTFKQSLMVYADDLQSVIPLTRYLGYKPMVTSPSTTKVSIYQLVPSIGSGVDNKPDSKYYLRIKSGMVLESSQNNVEFYTTDYIDFNDETDSVWWVYD